ncbi:MAG: hypothetical protein ISP90_01925 [Nevskia sp.]|nr:hypothetical protein [Nevskia sp.]
MLLAALLAPAAAWAQAAPADVSPLQLDQNIQQLKEQVLAIEQQAETLEQGYLYPTQSRVSFYIGTKTPGLVISKISLSLDGGAPVNYYYSEREGVALQDHGDLQRIFSCTLAPGGHRLHADFAAQYADARPQDRPFVGHLDTPFTKDDGPAEMELSLGQDASTAPLALKLRQWSSGGAGAYVAGGADDPRMRSAAFLADIGQYLSASALLLRIRNETPDQAMAPAFNLQLAQDTLDFGMPQRAQDLFDGAGAAALEPVELAKARLKLAEFLYQRGYYDRAAAELGGARGQLPPELAGGWQDLLSRVLLQQERYGEAADALGTVETAANLPLHMRYNLGVALIRGGRADQGVKVLDEAGRAATKDKSELPMRDKVNLSLGYYLMRGGQGNAAIPIFGRVRDQGAFANRALLGMGWAHLGPAGSAPAAGGGSGGVNPFASLATIGALLQSGAEHPDGATARVRQSIKLDALTPEQQARLRKALVPWVELISRDPMDPAVQEGMLAIPYALDGLGAHGEAQQYYERAIGALEQTHQRLQATMADVRNGRMVDAMVFRDADAENGWSWKLRDLPGVDEAFYLNSLLAENSFQESLKNYRDARLLQRALDTWNKHLGDLQDVYRARAQDNAGSAPDGGAAAEAALPALAGDAARRLMLANHLAVAVPQRDASGVVQAPLALKLAGMPEHFEGFYEQAQSLRDRIASLQPAVDQAAAAQRGVLQDVALADLGAQSNLVEKYLVESHLALARIYDSEPKGGHP